MWRMYGVCKAYVRRICDVYMAYVRRVGGVYMAYEGVCKAYI